MKAIDLRSDTITRPTEKMRQVIAQAEVGDDVYGEDPSINRLEQLAAEKLGKEKALFVPSGTMANQIAAMVHTNPGDEIITEITSHIFLYEAGGLGRLGGVQTHVLQGERGLFSPDALEGAIRGENIHFPRTTLVAFENTHNRAGGRVFSPEELAPHLEICCQAGIKTHLDGARIFNAAVALEITPELLVRDFDSVSFCLSKGLGAPVGSLLCGSADFVKQARQVRKILGGGMRQGGLLAAAGILALEEAEARLIRDHRLARILAGAIEKMDNFRLEFPVESNIVVGKYLGSQEIGKVVERLDEKGLLVNAFGPASLRLVTHQDVTEEEVYQAAEIMESI